MVSRVNQLLDRDSTKNPMKLHVHSKTLIRVSIACFRVEPGCVHACLTACLCLFLRACVRARVRPCMHPCMRACVRACVHACVRACVHVCLRVCVLPCVGEDCRENYTDIKVTFKFPLNCYSFNKFHEDVIKGTPANSKPVTMANLICAEQFRYVS